MRWLEWLPHDPRSIIGGVETHVLSMARCLEARGVQVDFSSDPSVLLSGRGYDVIRTHGDMLPRGYLWRAQKGAFRIHTLHGSAIGLMRGRSEWHRFRHFKSFYREFSGSVRSDLLGSIHPELGLYRWLGRRAPRGVVHWNGWDGGVINDAASDVIHDIDLTALARSWMFIGRVWDPVKGADRLLKALELDPSLELAVAPGDGLPDNPRVHKLGRLTSAQIRSVLARSRGLLLPSRFEGLSVVMLEALAAGVPVVASRVGGNPQVERCKPRGLHWFRSPDDANSLIGDIKNAACAPEDPERISRAEWNRAHLWSWEQCTDLLLQAVRAGMERRERSRNSM